MDSVSAPDSRARLLTYSPCTSASPTICASDYLAAGYGEEETAEFDQLGTIEAIDGALATLGHEVDRIGHARSLVERLARGDRWDLVFNICEGLRGAARESQVPAILDVYEIPYTFADPAVLAVCLDKALTKTGAASGWSADARLASGARPSPISTGSSVPFPVIAKPIAEGTGKGIDAASKVDGPADTAARRASGCSTNLVSRCSSNSFLPGREFTVGILGTGR